MTDATDGVLPLNGEPADGPQQDNAADPQRTEKIRRGKRKQEHESADFWQRILADEVGRREIWRILREFHPFEAKIATTPVGFPDERATWMELGVQLKGQRVFHLLYAQHPQLVLLMQSENDPNFPKPVTR